MTDDKKYQEALARRREVLGDSYVDGAIAREDGFNAPIQRFLTENIWGDVWGRGTLTRRERSFLTLAVLMATNRPAELRLHLMAARRNGCSIDEIREVLIHVSAYCGAPAAVDAMKQVNEVLADEIETAGMTGSRRKP